MDFDSIIELSRNAHLNWSHTSFTGTNYMDLSRSHDIPQAEIPLIDLDPEPSSPGTTQSRIPNPALETSSSGNASPHGSVELQGSGSNQTRRGQGLKEAAIFTCPQCPKKFTRSSTLREHARTHTNERPFSCSICEKTFVRLKDRNRHESLHTGEKKFICKGDLLDDDGHWGCGRKFAREDALAAHFRTKAGQACLRPGLADQGLKLVERGLRWRSISTCNEIFNQSGLGANYQLEGKPLGCESHSANYEELMNHWNSNTGRSCMRKFLTEFATLEARRWRTLNEASSPVRGSLPRSSPDFSVHKADSDSVLQTRQVDINSFQSRSDPERPLEINSVEAMQEHISKTRPDYSSHWRIRMEGNSHGVSGSYVHIEVESLLEVPRSSPNFWELKFGDCGINPHDNRVLRNGLKWIFWAPVPSFSDTKCISARVPLNFRIGWDKSGKDVLLYVGEFTYDYVDTALR